MFTPERPHVWKKLTKSEEKQKESLINSHSIRNSRLLKLILFFFRDTLGLCRHTEEYKIWVAHRRDLLRFRAECLCSGNLLEAKEADNSIFQKEKE